MSSLFDTQRYIFFGSDHCNLLKKSYFRAVKFIFIVIGVLSLVLGVIGIFVPLLPTTPFLLLSSALFVRSSPALYEWLISNRYLGKYIRNYRENRSIPMRGKITSVVLLWLSFGYCFFFVVQDVMWLRVVLVMIAVGTSWHILSLGTTPRK